MEEGGATSLSELINNNIPQMETRRHVPENTTGQRPVSMREVYDKRGGPGNYDIPEPGVQMQNLPPPQQNMQAHTQIRQPPQNMNQNMNQNMKL